LRLAGIAGKGTGGMSLFASAASGGREGCCPACDRHIGTVEECPYCGVEPPWAGRIRGLKAGSALVAAAGAAIVLAAARAGGTPALCVRETGPNRQAARVVESADWRAVAGIAAACGAAGAGAACVPGLHLFALMAFLAGPVAARIFGEAAPGLFVAACAAMAAGHSVAGSLPAVLLSAPDDTSFPAAEPGDRHLAEGLGVRAGFLTILGGLCASVLLAPWVLPAARLVPPVFEVVRPHLHWVIWTMIVFVLMSNRPGERLICGTAAGRLVHDLVPLAAGFLAFMLSGLLGCVVFFSSPLPVPGPYPGLVPVFAGLFAVPRLLVGLFAAPRPPLPRQSMSAGAAPSLAAVAAGAVAGSAGGLFAAAVPAFTGGIGNLISGRALSPACGAAFFISQGAVRVLWCAGGIALWLVLGIGPPGGGAGCPSAAALRTDPAGCLPVAAAAILIGAVAGAAAGVPLCAAFAGAAGRFGRRAICAAVLATLAAVVTAVSGFAGLGMLVAASAVGTMAAMHRANPANALGAALLPAACSLSGLGPAIGRLLGNG